jgi:bifunctional UDP-N-acetylglucosamine pyrophosphorylase/glucosamine-1-phosphate N-acetyltransferase
MPLSVVILAAGQGKRMKSDLPKVLQPLAGRPLLQHVIDTAQELGADDIHVVYGHGGERVRERLARERVTWALQAEQHGTGHAVQQAMPGVPDDHLVLVLYGDVPLVQAATLRRLIDASAGGEALALLSVRMRDPAGYGRIVRDRAGQRRCASSSTRTPTRKSARSTEVNTGLMAALGAAPARMARATAQRQRAGRVLPDRRRGHGGAAALKVRDRSPSARDEVLGVNDKPQLAEVEAVHRRQSCTGADAAGCDDRSIRCPLRRHAGRSRAGRDVVRRRQCRCFEGTVQLGDRVRIGPNACCSATARSAPTTSRSCPTASRPRAHRRAVRDRGPLRPAAARRPAARRGRHVGNFVEVKKARIAQGRQGPT